MNSSRSGLLAGGNFIVDHVKIIDAYPDQDMLASILGQTQANGGGPYNVLKDLAAMGATFPLAAAGMVGEDDNGRWIREDCRVHGINTDQLHATKERATSYTDAMTVAGTGRRTFFHQRGANALFNVEHVDFRNSSARIFHLGYLMLLDTLDSFAPDGRTHASHLLEKAVAAHLETCVDMVSTEHPQFREIALSALPYTHHLMLNEVEASRVLHRSIPADQPEALLSAATDLLGLGVRQSVTVHTEHGCASVTIAGEKLHQPSLLIPPGYSKGATGAGDAFAAGLLYGLHEQLSLAERLQLAVCTAAASLADPTPSAGLRPVSECLALAAEFGFRK